MRNQILKKKIGEKINFQVQINYTIQAQTRGVLIYSIILSVWRKVRSKFYVQGRLLTIISIPYNKAYIRL